MPTLLQYPSDVKVEKIIKHGKFTIILHPNGTFTVKTN